MKWIGLTGGIATGKSTVASILRSKSIQVIDADQLAKEAVQLGSEGLKKVSLHFGPAILNEDGSLNRKKMGELVFSDQKKRGELEQILHPIIQARVLELKSAAEKSGARVCFYDVPLLFEKQLQNQFDEVWLVTCSVEMQLNRIMLRDQLGAEQAKARIQSQMPIEQKEKWATKLLRNDADLDFLKKQVEAAIQSIQT